MIPKVPCYVAVALTTASTYDCMLSIWLEVMLMRLTLALDDCRLPVHSFFVFFANATLFQTLCSSKSHWWGKIALHGVNYRFDDCSNIVFC